jgi:hypothetical protein
MVTVVDAASRTRALPTVERLSGVRSSRARAVIIAVATMLALLAGASMVATIATYEGRQERTSARAPRDASLHPSERPVLDYFVRSDSLALKTMWVVYLRPYSDSTPLPPGLTVWPAEGSAVISPALQEDEQRIEDLFGTVEGFIGSAGLGSPGERLIYVRPTEATIDLDRMQPATGFGDTALAAQAGEARDVAPSYTLLALIAVLVLAPALIMLRAAVRVGDDRRRRHGEVLEILGMTPRRLLLLHLRQVRGSLGTGAAIALLMVAVSTAVDVPLPGVDYTLLAADMRTAWVQLVAAVALGAVLVVAVATATLYPRQLRPSTRARSHAPRYPGWAAFAGVAVIGATSGIAVQLAVVGDQNAVLFVIGGTLGAIALMPSLCGWLIVRLSAGIAAFGQRRGSASALIAGRQLAASVRPAERLASTSAVVILLITQVAVWSLMGLNEARLAEQLFRDLGDRYAVLTVPAAPSSIEVWPEVQSKLPSEVSSVRVTTRSAGEDTGMVSLFTELSAPAATLAALGLEEAIGDPDGAAIAAAALPDDLSRIVRPLLPMQQLAVLTAETTPLAEDSIVEQSIVLVAPESGGLNIQALQAEVNHVVAPGWNVGVPGESWRVGAWQIEHQSRWIGWFGTIGAAILLTALWVGASDEIRRSAIQVAPLGAMTGRVALFRHVAAARVGTAALVGAVVGATSALLYCQVIVAQRAGVDPPLVTVAALVVTICLISTGVWISAARAGQRAAQTWRPGRQER